MSVFAFPSELLSQFHVITSTLDRRHVEELRRCDPATHTDPELIRHFQSRLQTAEQTSSDVSASHTPPDEKIDQTPFRHQDCCLSLSPRLFSILTTDIFPYVAAASSAVNSPGTSAFVDPGLVLSIGSGTGLLERGLQLSALAIGHSPSSPFSSADSDPEFDTMISCSAPMGYSFVPGLPVHGVEVHSSVNKYLPDSSMSVVRGTWEVSRNVELARVLMFVYPRRVDLIGRYLQRFSSARQREASRDSTSKGVRISLVVWLGPLVDWDGGGFGEEVKRWADETGATVEERRGTEMGLMPEEMGVLVRCGEAVNSYVGMQLTA